MTTQSKVAAPPVQRRAARTPGRVRVPLKLVPENARRLDELCSKDRRSRNNMVEFLIELKHRQMFGRGETGGQ